MLIFFGRKLINYVIYRKLEVFCGTVVNVAGPLPGETEDT